MNVAPPAGYQHLRVRGGYMLAAAAIATWAEEAIGACGSLEHYARRQPGVQVIAGRGPAYLVDLGTTGTGVVRRLRHGGRLAAFTGDRFFDRRLPRPINELLTSVLLAGRGIDTPRVLAACVYPSLWHYRGEVLRTYHAECTDLASYLFGSDRPDAVRAVATAARMADRLAAAGVFHPDYNAMNLLVQPEPPDLRVLVIDLEKSASCAARPERARVRMRRRLAHSLAKLAARAGRPLPAEVWDALEGPLG
jgi:hypothetical protein